MMPHITANEIDLAKNVLSFATALIGLFALLKNVRSPQALHKQEKK
jgi:hypothetical protein